MTQQLTPADAVAAALARPSRLDVEAEILGALYWLRKGRRCADEVAVRHWGEQVNQLLDTWQIAAPI